MDLGRQKSRRGPTGRSSREGSISRDYLRFTNAEEGLSLGVRARPDGQIERQLVNGLERLFALVTDESDAGV